MKFCETMSFFLSFQRYKLHYICLWKVDLYKACGSIGKYHHSSIQKTFLNLVPATLAWDTGNFTEQTLIKIREKNPINITIFQNSPQKLNFSNWEQLNWNFISDHRLIS